MCVCIHEIMRYFRGTHAHTLRCFFLSSTGVERYKLLIAVSARRRARLSLAPARGFLRFFLRACGCASVAGLLTNFSENSLACHWRIYVLALSTSASLLQLRFLSSPGVSVNIDLLFRYFKKSLVWSGR